MTPKEISQSPFIHSPFCHAHCDFIELFIVGDELTVIEQKEEFRGSQCCSLVPVDECMITAKVIEVGSCLFRDGAMEVSAVKSLPWHGCGCLKQSVVSDPVTAAELCD